MGFLPRALVTAATVSMVVPRFPAKSFDEPAHFDRIAETNGWERSHDAPDGELVLVRFWLKQTHLTELKERLKRVSDPTSPDYGHYMTKEQVDALTAPSEKDVVVVKEALRGYDIHEQNKGAVISAKVPISFAERTLGGNFVYYCRSVAAEASDDPPCALRNPTAQVPAALRAACDLITPLDDPLAPLLSPPVHGPVIAQQLGPVPLIARGVSGPVPLDASEGLQAAADDGCCFSIGFGANMKPCCLTTSRGAGKSECKVGRRIGGETGFRRGSCPATAEEAADLLKTGRGGSSNLQTKGSDGQLPPTDLTDEQSGASGGGSAGIVVVGIVAACGLIAAAVVIKRAQRGSGAAPLLVAE